MVGRVKVGPPPGRWSTQPACSASRDDTPAGSGRFATPRRADDIVPW
jgi:hypothetical protein